MVKELRFWNKQLTPGEIANYRYRQVDPLEVEAEMLLSYFRLATGSSTIDNFAQRNPSYEFNETNVEMFDLDFVDDFVEQKKYMYDKKEKQVVSQLVRTYHTVCPMYTYFMDQFCYNEPVNKAILAVFPIWEPQSQELNWEMTLLYSSVIDQELVKYLKDDWKTDDIILQDFFDQRDEDDL